LHIFGFRPDLSRRPKDTRVRLEGGREQFYSSCESAALDVLFVFKDSFPTLGRVSDLGTKSFRLFEVAFSASEQLGEYLVAGAFLRRDIEASSPIIRNALKTIYHITAGWAGSDVLNATISLLRTLAAIPDEFQDARIHEILLCSESDRSQTDGQTSLGLIAAAQQFYDNRAHQTYPQDLVFAYERYVGILKDFLSLKCVCKWMNENRTRWAWMEGDLFESRRPRGRGQSRNDYSGSREPDDGGFPLDHHHHNSDSDGMAGVHDSEDDDEEDSRIEDMDLYQESSPASIVISGAGVEFVNGSYAKDGSCDGVLKYSKTGQFRGGNAIFSIFKCDVSNNTKHWYISIVPPDTHPGSSSDIDFYSAPVTPDCQDLPPLSGWVKANEGEDPAPNLKFVDVPVRGVHYGQVGYEDWSDDQEGNAVQSFV
jgi:ubiquitin carboxyl-terminal hydrolase 9/24